MSRWDHMTQAERDAWAAVRKRNDFDPAEKCAAVDWPTSHENPPCNAVSDPAFREVWERWCVEHDVPIGGGSLDRRRRFADEWGVSPDWSKVR